MAQFQATSAGVNMNQMNHPLIGHMQVSNYLLITFNYVTIRESGLKQNECLL